MRRDSRPGQASCCRLVTKRTKFNLHFAFMPPFQIGEEQLGQEVVFQARGGICCAATPASDPVVSGWSVSRFGHGRRPRSNASRLSPISHLRAAGRHRRASRLHNRTEGVVAQHTVSQPEKLVRGSRARPWAKIVTSTAVRPKLGCPPDRRKTAEGKWTASRGLVCRIERITRNKEYYSISLRGISNEYQQN